MPSTATATTTTSNESTMVEVVGDSDEDKHKPPKQPINLTLYTILNTLIADILNYESTPLLSQIPPLLPEASSNSARNVLRPILLVSVGTVTSLVLTGLLVFVLFFIAATVNAIIISLLVSLAVAGGFLAMFFACVAAIYIGALLVAAIVLCFATMSAIVVGMTATGWIGFFCTVWLATRGSIHMAKRSLKMTGSVVSTNSVTPDSHHDNNESTKKSD